MESYYYLTPKVIVLFDELLFCLHTPVICNNIIINLAEYCYQAQKSNRYWLSDNLDIIARLIKM